MTGTLTLLPKAQFIGTRVKLISVWWQPSLLTPQCLPPFFPQYSILILVYLPLIYVLCINIVYIIFVHLSISVFLLMYIFIHLCTYLITNQNLQDCDRLPNLVRAMGRKNADVLVCGLDTNYYKNVNIYWEQWGRKWWDRRLTCGPRLSFAQWRQIWQQRKIKDGTSRNNW